MNLLSILSTIINGSGAIITPPPPPTGFSPTFILWLGDSIVRGESSSDYNVKSYVALTSNHFGSAWTNKGTSGAVVKPGWHGLPDNGFSLYGYQTPFANTGFFGAGYYVYLAFGTNDINTPTDADFKANYKTEIEKIIAFGYTPAQIIIGTAPYQSARPNMPGAITQMQEIASELGTRFFNAYAYTQANGGDSLLADGIHPTDAGHQIFANGLIAYLESL